MAKRTLNSATLIFIEEFLKKELFSDDSSLTSAEIDALEHDCSSSFQHTTIIERIKLNDVLKYFNTEHQIIHSSIGRLFDITNKNELLKLIRSRMFFLKTDKSGNLKYIKVYIPDASDTHVFVDASMISFSEYIDILKQMKNEINFHMQNNCASIVDFFFKDTEKICNEEFFTFTKYKIENSTIILHYVP